MDARNRRSLPRKCTMWLCFAALIVGLVAFAPAQIGGHMTYIIVSGNSMEPTYHSGDLVLVREREAFQLGDIAVYQHPQLGQVIHRIIAREGQGYVFKGDNNSFIDGYRPSRTELVGEAWFAAPGAGKVLRILRRPLPLAILTVLSIAGIAGGTSTAARRRGGTRPARRRRLDGRMGVN